MSTTISKVAIKFGLLHTNISKVCREYKVSSKTNFKYPTMANRKETWKKNGNINDWKESLHEIDVQIILKMLWIKMQGYQQVPEYTSCNVPLLLALRSIDQLVYRCWLRSTRPCDSAELTNTIIKQSMVWFCWI